MIRMHRRPLGLLLPGTPDPALFDAICRALGVEPTRRGEAHIPCPSCGHRVVPGATHFSFNAKAGYCFVCGYKCSLRSLAERYRVDGPGLGAVAVQPAAPVPPVTEAEPGWYTHPDAYLTTYTAAADRTARWQAYKPLSAAAIDRWQLGVGVLPETSYGGHPGGCAHRRLIYPVYEGGRVVAFRGRHDGCTCDVARGKWLSASGSSARLFNVDLLEPGATVIVVENPVDAILIMDRLPRLVAIAGTAGVGTWRADWTRAVARSQPERVIVMLDNDLAGQASGYRRQQLEREWRAAWRARNPDADEAPTPPTPRGPRLADELAQAGVPTVLYEWPYDAPPKADAGEVIASMVEGLAS